MGGYNSREEQVARLELLLMQERALFQDLGLMRWASIGDLKPPPELPLHILWHQP